MSQVTTNRASQTTSPAAPSQATSSTASGAQADDFSVRVGGAVVSTPVASIIMPSYNTAQYIVEAVESVLAQTFESYEIVVVNDGSPDTPELERVLAPYLERIVYIKQQNHGQATARNRALRASRGAFVVFLDSDDALMPDYLARQIAEMERDPSIDVLYPNALIFGDAPDAGMLYMDVCPSEGEVTFESIVNQRCNVFITATARREAVLGVGMFDDTVGKKVSEDYDLWLRIAKAGGRIAYHRQVLVRYRRRPGSVTANPVVILERALWTLQKCERTMELTESEQSAVREEIARTHAQIRLDEGKQAFARGEVRAGVEALTEANAYFRSVKLKMIILLMRLAPGVLQNVYNSRRRIRERKADEVQSVG